MHKLISVGITAFKEGDLLKESFESVISQTFTNWNLVIVLDGGADKKTEKIFDSLEHPSLNKIKLDKNFGPYYCRTLAIRKSNSKWYCHLDADDCLPIKTLEILNEYQIKYPECEYFWGKCMFFNGKIYNTEFVRDVDLDLQARYMLIYGQAPIKIDLFNKLDGFNKDLYWGGADWDFWIRLLSKSIKGQFIDEILYERRIISDSIGNNWELTRDKIVKIIINNNKEFYSKNNRESESLGKTYEMMARKHRSLWNRKLAKKYAIKARDVNWYFKAQDEIIFEAGMNLFRYYVRKLRVLV